MSTGLTLCERIEQLKDVADIDVVAVIVIADLTNAEAKQQGQGTMMLEERYNTKVYSIIAEKDILNVLN